MIEWCLRYFFGLIYDHDSLLGEWIQSFDSNILTPVVLYINKCVYCMYYVKDRSGVRQLKNRIFIRLSVLVEKFTVFKS